jgi:hypothetical protein
MCALAWGLALASVAGGCSFTSVATTGRAGSRLAAYEHAFEYSAEFCRLLGEPIEGGPGTVKCEDLARDREIWRRLFSVLSLYGTTLEWVATGRWVDVDSLVSASLLGVDIDGLIDEDSPKEVSFALVALVDLLAQQPRRKHLRKALRQVEGPIAKVIVSARANVEINLVNLCAIDHAAEIAARTWGAARCVDGEPACTVKSNGVRMSLEHVRVTAKKERLLLMELDAALESFAVAHARLCADSGKIGRPADKRLDERIKAEIRAAVENSETKLAQYEDCEPSVGPDSERGPRGGNDDD